MTTVLLALAFCGAAAIYASAGFGGGSAYLALLALAAIPTRQASVIALFCNVIVVARTTILAARLRQLDWASVVALGVFSVPAAWLGAVWPLQDRWLDFILAFTLLASAIALASPKRAVDRSDVPPRTPVRRLGVSAALGAPLGFLGGMVGIGGGVFLSPLLHFLKWNDSRRIATLCSAFILVNSVAGLLGKCSRWTAVFELETWWALPLGVAVGGMVGTRWLLTTLSHRWITRATAVVVGVAAMQTLWRALAH